MHDSAAPGTDREVGEFHHAASFHKDSLEGAFCSSVYPWLLHVGEKSFGTQLLVNPFVEKLCFNFGVGSRSDDGVNPFTCREYSFGRFVF